jgi:hypothetical protein
VTQALRGLPGPDLVPGQLRGFRQFELRDDGLYPLVHTEFGPWDGELERASCGDGEGHHAPAADCRCGLYGWYLPGSATVALGRANAVVAVRGRCILGDRGFRAAAAHIDAVALPAAIRWDPRAARRARSMLAARYPDTVVYDSTRRMLKHYPPDDVSALGIRPRPDRSRGYRAATVALWLALVLPTYALFVLPRDVIAGTVSHWWPVVLLLAVAWQVGMVWLLTRLLSLQTANPPGRAQQQP